MFSSNFTRRDISLLGRWWWTVDRWLLASLFIVIGIGVLLSFSASPSVADRLNLGGFFFVKRHILMLGVALIAILSVSMMTAKSIRRLAVVIYLAGLVGLILTLQLGTEIKGARRWLNFGGLSIQVSEFIKPAFALLIGWMLAEKNSSTWFPGFAISCALLTLFVGGLLLQPDLGMTLVVVSTWFGQLFIAGFSLFWMAVAAFSGVIGLIGAYFFFPHVARRIDQFFDPSSGDPRHDLYQVHQSLESFMSGGLFGKGPGEGVIKKNVPDAHADFVFAVAGEEFGLFLCLLLVGLFFFITLRSLWRAMSVESQFVMLGVSGIVIQFSLQAIVNMASSLHLIPTKGMTMPFVSYGGSSLVALGIAMGMVLSLTRQRYGVLEHV